MTTIAFDGYDFAADTQVVCGTFRAGFVPKIQPWSKGYFAMAGKLQNQRILFQYLETGSPKKPGKNFGALVWNAETQTMFEADESFLFFPCQCPNATGSGQEVALHYMLNYGYSAERAVREAIKHDTATGGEVQVVHLRKKRDGKYSPNYSRLSLKPAVQ